MKTFYNPDLGVFLVFVPATVGVCAHVGGGILLNLAFYFNIFISVYGIPSGLEPCPKICNSLIFYAFLFRQAMNVGKAPLVALEASHRNALRVNSIEEMSSP